MSTGIEISKRLVLINSLSSVLRKVVVVGVLVWVQQYYARRLDPEEYQLLPITQALILFFPLLPSVFVTGLRRYITDAYARREEGEVTSLVSTMALPVMGLTLLILLSGGTCAWFIADILRIDPRFEGQAQIMFALLTVGVSVRFAAAPYGLGFDLKQRFVLRNVIGLCSELFRTALLIGLLLYSTKVMWVVVSNTIATVIEMALVTGISRRLVPALRYARGAARRAMLAPLLSFGGWSLLNQVSMMVRESADNLILNRLSTGVQVSSFYLGGLLDRHVRHTYLEATANAQTVVTAMNATGKADQFRNAFLRISRYSLWSLLFAAAPLIVFREELARLYLRERYELYAVSASVMALLLARVLVLFPNAILGMMATAKAAVKPMALRTAAMSAANLGITLYLVGVLKMGALGSALGTVIVSFVGTPLLYWTMALRLADTRFSTWLRASILPGLLPVLASLPIWLAVHFLAAPTSWAGVFLGFAAGAAVYLPMVWFFGLQVTERRDALTWLKQLRS